MCFKPNHFASKNTPCALKSITGNNTINRRKESNAASVSGTNQIAAIKPIATEGIASNTSIIGFNVR